MNKKIAIVVVILALIVGLGYLAKKFEIIKITPAREQTKEKVSLDKKESTLESHDTSKICAVYITGVGCPHCAVADPKVLEDFPKEYPNLIIIEYEIYQQRENAPLIERYNSNYGSGLGVPLIIFRKDQYIVGDRPILTGVPKFIESVEGNFCPLLEESISFEKLDITSIPRHPKIWVKDRILISSEDKNGDNKLLKELITTEDISSTLEKIDHEVIDPQPIPLSGKNVEFEKAVKIEDWTFQWNE